VHEHLQIKSEDRDLRGVAAAGGFDLATREGKYRALLALTDREIGKVIAEIARRGLTDRTAIVFFSDHGESLGEDERLPDNHGLYVYHALVHVALAIHVPGGPAGPSDEPVTLLDLTPTVLELFGLAPWPELAGRSLLPHLVAGAPEALLSEKRALPLNESDQWGVIVWPDKLLVRPKDNLVELYDLSRDPGERTDRAQERPDLVAQLKAQYQAFPAVNLDRTRKGREQRDKLALPPRRR
jgi:arylsulfatase A-like enzyme